MNPSWEDGDEDVEDEGEGEGGASSTENLSRVPETVWSKLDSDEDEEEQSTKEQHTFSGSSEISVQNGSSSCVPKQTKNSHKKIARTVAFPEGVQN